MHGSSLDDLSTGQTRTLKGLLTRDSSVEFVTSRPQTPALGGVCRDLGFALDGICPELRVVFPHSLCKSTDEHRCW